jgi:hypothetical protein
MPTEHHTAHVTAARVTTLEQIAERDQVWRRVAEQHGVANPLPPWKTSLDGMCDALDAEGCTLAPLTRRHEDDLLSAEVYPTLPYPENQLVALAHSLIARNVIDEAALTDRLDTVRGRLSLTTDS